MIDLSGIKNIFFDLGGVLIDLDKERCLGEFRKLGIRQIEKQIGNSFKSGLFLRLEEGLITPKEFRNEIRQMTGVKISDAEIDNAWNAFLQEIPVQKLALLKALQSKYRVFMLSNTNKIHFDFMQDNHFCKEKGYSLNDCFEKCYLSYELHLSKPDEAIFRAVIKDSGVSPQESLFLDDNQQNIESAQRLGFQTCLVPENEDFTTKFVFE